MVLMYSLASPFRLRRYSKNTFVSISHNDCILGDIYVNHGLHKALVRERGMRLILRNPLHLFLLLREALRHNLGLYQRVVCLSQSEATRLARHYRIRRPIHVIPNGVDTVRFQPAASKSEARRRLGLDEDSHHAVFVGHDFERKGLAIALQVMTRTPQGVRLLVVGGSEGDVLAWRDRAESLGLGGRVAFYGRRSDVELFLQAADLFLFPSAFEAFGLVTLEAMACGLPVVVTPEAAVGDYIEDERNGFLASTMEEFAQCICRLLADDGLRDSVGRAARDTAKGFGWERVAGEYASLIQSVWHERL